MWDRVCPEVGELTQSLGPSQGFLNVIVIVLKEESELGQGGAVVNSTASPIPRQAGGSNPGGRPLLFCGAS